MARTYVAAALNSARQTANVHRDDVQELGTRSDSRQLMAAVAAMHNTADALAELVAPTLDPERWLGLAALPAAVIWLNRHGVIEQCNANALQVFGAPLLGRSWRAILDGGIVREANKGVLVGGNRHVMSSAPFEGGQLLLLMAVNENATQEGSATSISQSEGDERQVRLAELGQVAAGLAHQLRTPLATAQLYLDLARDSGRSDLLAEVQTALDSLTRHTESLLTFARGGVAVDDVLDPQQWCADLKRQSKALLRDGKVIRWRMDVAERLFACNRHLLLGACLNLIENALQASDAGTTIAVQFCGNANQLWLHVLDRGRGAPESICQDPGRAFTTTRNNGTGLGLTMARLIARAHGGGLEIKRRPRGGTLASIWVNAPLISSNAVHLVH